MFQALASLFRAATKLFNSFEKVADMANNYADIGVAHSQTQKDVYLTQATKELADARKLLES